MTNRIKNSKYKKAAFIPAIAMMILIFFFSHMDADSSDVQSDGVAYFIVSAVNSVFDLYESEEELIAVADSINHIIRKIAHFTEYMILAMLLIFGLYVNGSRKKRMYAIATVITAIYACTDEFHQLFIPGRYGSIIDVLIDSAGGVFGCIIVAMVCRLVNNRRLVSRTTGM